MFLKPRHPQRRQQERDEIKRGHPWIWVPVLAALGQKVVYVVGVAAVFFYGLMRRRREFQVALPGDLRASGSVSR